MKRRPKGVTRPMWRTVGLLAGSLCLGNLAIAPAMAATVTYTFSGVVTGIDSALTAHLPSGRSSPLSRMSGSMNVLTTQQIGSKSHPIYFGSRVQFNVGSYQVLFRSTSGDHRVAISNSDSSEALNRASSQDGLTLTPNSPVNSWLPQSFFVPLERPPSHFTSTASLPDPSNLPASISAFSQANQWRLPFNSDSAATNPVAIVHGPMISFPAVPLPASLIIVGVGLVALIGLGAGRLQAN